MEITSYQFKQLPIKEQNHIIETYSNTYQTLQLRINKLKTIINLSDLQQETKEDLNFKLDNTNITHLSNSILIQLEIKLLPYINPQALIIIDEIYPIYIIEKENK